MSHFFDLIGMHRKLFRLSHLALGTREYARLRQLHRGEIDHQSDWSIYYIQIRTAISNDLIELASKIRIAQDTMRGELSETELGEMDSNALAGLGIGQVVLGSFELTLRESCNKIIHAKQFELGIGSARSTRPPSRYNYWDGTCTLKGVQNRKTWQVKLEVHNWCDAMGAFSELMAEYVEW